MRAPSRNQKRWETNERAGAGILRSNSCSRKHQLGLNIEPHRVSTGAIGQRRTKKAAKFLDKAPYIDIKPTGRQLEMTMLAEIYGWFTEGFDTADLKDAKALLNELNE
jgi:hypothetical protein